MARAQVTLVIAGNRRQFEYWRGQGRFPEDARYVASARDLLGHRPEDVKVIQVGTPAERRDYRELMDVAWSRGLC